MIECEYQNVIGLTTKELAKLRSCGEYAVARKSPAYLTLDPDDLAAYGFETVEQFVSSSKSCLLYDWRVWLNTRRTRMPEAWTSDADWLVEFVDKAVIAERIGPNTYRMKSTLAERFEVEESLTIRSLADIKNGRCPEIDMWVPEIALNALSDNRSIRLRVSGFPSDAPESEYYRGWAWVVDGDCRLAVLDSREGITTVRVGAFRIDYGRGE